MSRNALDILNERVENNPELKRIYDKEKAKVNKRTLTLVIEFDQDSNPDWIWGSHMKQIYRNGVLVKSIYEGDLLKNDEDDE